MKTDTPKANYPKAKYDAGQVQLDFLSILLLVLLPVCFVAMLWHVFSMAEDYKITKLNKESHTLITETYDEMLREGQPIYIDRKVVEEEKYQFGRVEDYLVIQPEYGDEILFQSDDIKSKACDDPLSETCFDPERETLIVCHIKINDGKCSDVASAKPEREKLGLPYEPTMNKFPRYVVTTELYADGNTIERTEDY